MSTPTAGDGGGRQRRYESGGGLRCRGGGRNKQLAGRQGAGPGLVRPATLSLNRSISYALGLARRRGRDPEPVEGKPEKIVHNGQTAADVLCIVVAQAPRFSAQPFRQPGSCPLCTYPNPKSPLPPPGRRRYPDTSTARDRPPFVWRITHPPGLSARYHAPYLPRWRLRRLPSFSARSCSPQLFFQNLHPNPTSTIHQPPSLPDAPTEHRPTPPAPGLAFPS